MFISWCVAGIMCAVQRPVRLHTRIYEVCMYTRVPVVPMILVITFGSYGRIAKKNRSSTRIYVEKCVHQDKHDRAERVPCTDLYISSLRCLGESPNPGSPGCFVCYFCEVRLAAYGDVNVDRRLLKGSVYT